MSIALDSWIRYLISPSEDQGSKSSNGCSSDPRVECCSTATKPRPSAPPFRASERIHPRPQCNKAGAHVCRSIYSAIRKRPCRWRLYYGQGPRVSPAFCKWEWRRCGEGLGSDQPGRDMECTSARRDRQGHVLDERQKIAVLRK